MRCDMRWLWAAIVLAGCSEAPAGPVVNVWVVPPSGGQGGAAVATGGSGGAVVGGAAGGLVGGQDGGAVPVGGGGQGGAGGAGGEAAWWLPDHQCEHATDACDVLLDEAPCASWCYGWGECVGLFCSEETGAPGSCAAAAAWTGDPWICPHQLWCCRL